MKIYLAASVTGDEHDLNLLKEIVDLVKGHGHQVLSEHIASNDPRGEVFERNAGISLKDKTLEERENIVRECDFVWLEESDLFIGLFFSPSYGVGIEFEHLRLMNALARKSLLRLVKPFKQKTMLCIFLEDQKRSAMVWGIDNTEKYYIHQISIKEKREALFVISNFLFLYQSFENIH